MTEPISKKRPGEGSVTEVATGFWVRIPVGGKRRSFGVHATAELADEVRRAALEDLVRADLSTLDGVTLRDFGARYLAERALDGVRDTRTERSRWTTHIETAPFAGDPVATITAPVVNAWKKTLQAKMIATPGHKPRKLSRKTVREVVGLLRSAFAQAQVEGLVAQNPVEAIRVRSEAKTHEPWTYLEPHEQTANLTCTEIPEADRMTIAFALGSGLREGEQFALRLTDLHVAIDEKNPRAVVRFGSLNKPPKNGKIRTVPLFGIALAAARRWLELLPSYATRKGEYHNPLGLVFPGRSGGHRGKGKHLHASRTVTLPNGKRKAIKVNLFKEYLALAGIVAERRHDGRPVRWQDLRHSCASSLVAGWWGPV
jgi:integrase